MKYQYDVLCWVPPKSGFELRDKHIILENLRKSLKKLAKDEISGLVQHIDSSIDKFISEYDGLVVEFLRIESDKIITNPEKEILPEIHKDFPGAKIIFCFNSESIISTLID